MENNTDHEQCWKDAIIIISDVPTLDSTKKELKEGEKKNEQNLKFQACNSIQTRRTPSEPREHFVK